MSWLDGLMEQPPKTPHGQAAQIGQGLRVGAATEPDPTAARTLRSEASNWSQIASTLAAMDL